MGDLLSLFDIDVIFRFPERFLYIIPILGVLAFFFIRKIKLVQTSFDHPWYKMHLSLARIPTWRSRLVVWLSMGMAFFLLIGVWAEPERRVITQEPIYGEVRITFLFDTSRSMRHGYDVLPNRLEAAKNVIKEFTGYLWSDPELKGHYSLAIIPFAQGVLETYLPFTTSRSEFLWALDGINEQTITKQGTSLATALWGYRELLFRRPASAEGTVDLAILISDGGKGEGVEDEIPLRELMLDELPQNVIIATVGIGKVEIIDQGKGLPKLRRTEPVKLAIKDAKGNFVAYLHEDQDDLGSPILTSELDEEGLRRIAHTPDNYYHFTDSKKLIKALSQSVLKYRKHTADKERILYEPVLPWFLVPAFVLLYFALGFHRWIVYGLGRLRVRLFTLSR